jgi:hypothetical protein
MSEEEQLPRLSVDVLLSVLLIGIGLVCERFGDPRFGLIFVASGIAMSCIIIPLWGLTLSFWTIGKLAGYIRNILRREDEKRLVETGRWIDGY